MIETLSRHVWHLWRFVLSRRLNCFFLDGKWVFFHVEPGASNNGVRFWQSLEITFRKRASAIGYVVPSIVYANVDVSPIALILYKIVGAIIIRVDGLYSEKPEAFIFDHISFFKKSLLKILLRLTEKLGVDQKATAFNLLHRNSSIASKIGLSDFIVYQSEYSRSVFNFMKLEKNGTVILNGAPTHEQFNITEYKSKSTLKLITTFAGGERTNKRQSELYDFISWLHWEKKLPVELTILGLEAQNLPLDLDENLIMKIHNAAEFRILGAFDLAGYPDSMSREMLNANAYITFTYRDPCPNAVVEAQSYGLPVLALGSGGVTEIVGHGGELIPIDDFPNGYLWSNLNNKDYPKIDAHEVYLSLKKVIQSLPKYQEKARSNFLNNLEISKVSEQYLKLLKRF